MGLLDSYRVGVDGAWSFHEAAHLYRRAGFGAAPAELTSAVHDGSQPALTRTVDALVNVLPDDPLLDGPNQGLSWGGAFAGLPLDDSNEGRTRAPDTLAWLQAHFLYRMRYTSQPFQEQFTLFLHDHFVSQYRKVRQGVNKGQRNCGNVNKMTVDLLQTQLTRYRRQGLDAFADTLLAVTREPAMLLYLDNYANKAAGPQENYAREMMELFSMGVGNFTEADVREVAKCLTGETLPKLRDCGAEDALHYGFRERWHADGEKRVFEQPVAFSNTGQETLDVVRLILAQPSQQPSLAEQPAAYGDLPAAAVYLAWKLLRWFVNQDVPLDPPHEAVLELADYLRGSDDAPYPARRYPYDMRAAMGHVFRSRYFFAEENRLAVVKTPADYVIGGLRLLGLELPRRNNRDHPAKWMKAMGMELFNPPNVSGWTHGHAWIHAGSLITRFNWADTLTTTLLSNDIISVWKTSNGGPLNPADHAGIVAFFEELLVQGDLVSWAPGARAKLLEFVDAVEAENGNANQRFREKVRGVVWLIMNMPIWQMK